MLSRLDNRMCAPLVVLSGPATALGVAYRDLGIRQTFLLCHLTPNISTKNIDDSARANEKIFVEK